MFPFEISVVLFPKVTLLVQEHPPFLEWHFVQSSLIEMTELSTQMHLLAQTKPLVVSVMMVSRHCHACALLFENLRQRIQEDSSQLMNLALSFLVRWLDAMHHRCCRGIACWMTLSTCCFCMNDKGNVDVQHVFFSSQKLRNEGLACLKTLILLSV